MEKSIISLNELVEWDDRWISPVATAVIPQSLDLFTSTYPGKITGVSWDFTLYGINQESVCGWAILVIRDKEDIPKFDFDSGHEFLSNAKEVLACGKLVLKGPTFPIFSDQPDEQPVIKNLAMEFHGDTLTTPGPAPFAFVGPGTLASVPATNVITTPGILAPWSQKQVQHPDTADPALLDTTDWKIFINKPSKDRNKGVCKTRRKMQTGDKLVFIYQMQITGSVEEEDNNLDGYIQYFYST